jgi:hypothetical protein
MLKGAFIRGDGLVIPNNITDFGAQKVLSLALLNTDNYDFFVGLCSGVYDHVLQIESLTEPTIDVNGYSRIHVTRDIVGWPGSGNLNGEFFVESDWLEWTAAVGPFSQPITRMFICGDETLTAGMPIFALSGALPNPITIGLTTPEINRKFKYRLYLR